MAALTARYGVLKLCARQGLPSDCNSHLARHLYALDKSGFGDCEELL
jgi:hypothetical protein